MVRKKEIKPKSQLEYIAGLVWIYSFVGITGALNEIIQQGKRAYIYLSGGKAERVKREDVYAETFFDIFSTYVRKPNSS
jgi:hypothetical protein